MYLGIEIGGTKLQLGLGHGDGKLLALWRGSVDAAAGGEGIRGQIVGGEIYRGVGKGAAEIGHLRPVYPLSHYTGHDEILEHYAAGWGIARAAEDVDRLGADASGIRRAAGGGPVTGRAVAEAARQGDAVARGILD